MILRNVVSLLFIMPEIRRSNRIQAKNTDQKTKQTCRNSQNVPPVKPKVVKSKTFIKSETSKVCAGCRNIHPPIRRYNVVQWVQCDNCDSWWHSECVCVTPENILKLDLYEIPYTCVLCVLQGSPWKAENHKIKVSVPEVLNQGSESLKKQESNIVQQESLRETDSGSVSESLAEQGGKPI